MLFDFIKSLAPTVKRSSVEDDIKDSLKNYNEIAVPSAMVAADILKLQSKKSHLFENFNDIFYHNVSIRRSNYFLDDFVSTVQNCVKNLEFIRGEVSKTLEEDTITDVIDANKAQLIRAVASLSQISDLIPVCLNALLRSQSALIDNNVALVKTEHEEIVKLFRRLSSLMSAYGRSTDTFKKQFRSVPEARITLDNMSQVQAMHLKEIDPFAEAEANGFSIHPVLLLREQWANFTIWRYERNKRLKKTFELRVLMLQAQRSKENTAALEQQIEFYENEIVKYTDKINAFEQKWGR